MIINNSYYMNDEQYQFLQKYKRIHKLLLAYYHNYFTVDEINRYFYFCKISPNGKDELLRHLRTNNLQVVKDAIANRHKK